MKTLKKHLLKAIILTMLLPTLSFAQEVIEYSNFKVGDTVPDFFFKNLTKYKKTEQKLSDFSEKLLIIDFWATWCSPCVGMLPRMDSLRRALINDLIFISITSQPKVYAEPFLEKVEKNKGAAFDIPVIYGDTTIRKLFPHRSLPHYVWIDVDSRKVIGITKSQYVTKENINRLLKYGSLDSIPEKRDRRLNYSSSEPLLGYLTGLSNQEKKFMPQQYSSFWSYIPELTSGITAHLWDSIGNNRIVARNVGKRMLISYAFGEGRKFFQSNSILLETKDKDKFYTNLAREPFHKWMAENGVTYEISVLPENRDKIFEIMKMDMINYFHNYYIRIEKRKSNSMVLISTGSNEKARSKGGSPNVTKDQFGYEATNITLNAFFGDLSFYYLSDSPVLVDETGIDFNIDLDLDVLNFHNINELNRELGKYNLKFVEKEAKAEFLVISDRE